MTIDATRRIPPAPTSLRPGGLQMTFSAKRAGAISWARQTNRFALEHVIDRANESAGGARVNGMHPPLDTTLRVGCAR